MRDILLQASTHPEPTPDWAMERTAELAGWLGAKVSLGICQVHLPPMSNWLANGLIGLDGMIAGENERSRANGEDIALRFAELVPADSRGRADVIECPGMVTPWQLAIRARAHDLTVVPCHGPRGTADMVEGLVFESGRPVLMLPEAESDSGTRSPGFEQVVVAWDGSIVAARALAAALPILRRAASVAVVQVLGDKDLSRETPLDDVIRHLAFHDVAADPIRIDLGLDDDAAATLDAYCAREGSDLVIMGAYGRSRAREFILGGVTRSTLAAPRRPVLISH